MRPSVQLSDRFGFVQRLITFIIALGTPLSMPAKVCLDNACLSLSGRLASVDSTQSPLLNAVAGQLLGTSVSLTAGQWESLASADIDALSFLDALAIEAGAGGPDEVLATNVTLLNIVDAAITVLTSEGNLAAVNALQALSLSLPSTLLPIGDLLDICVNCNEIANANFYVHDLLTGSFLLLNHQDPFSTPTPITLSGSAIGLGSLLGSVELAVKGAPPVFKCGPAGTYLEGAALRIYLGIDLVDINILSDLSAAGFSIPTGITNLNAQVGRLDLYVDVGQAEAIVTSVSGDSGSVSVTATPSVANLYLGEIDPAVFFDLSHTIVPTTDLNSAEIGDVEFTALFTSISASINASGYAEGIAPLDDLLSFFGPYPETQTAGSSGTFITNLLATLTSSLDIDIEVTEPSIIGGLLQTVINALLSTLLPAIQSVIPTVILSPLETLLESIVDPLLEFLGIGIGEAIVTVGGTNQHCTYSISGYVYDDSNRNGFREDDENGIGQTLYAKRLLVPDLSGDALEWTLIDASSGYFEFTGLDQEEYAIVVDDNNSLSDTSPTVPDGYFYSESSDGFRFATLAGVSDLNRVNFGLASGYPLDAQVFYDNGLNGGIAHDGTPQSFEIGYGQLRWELREQTGQTLLASGQTNAEGEINAVIPASVANGVSLCLILQPEPESVRISGSPGNANGSLADDQLCFTFDELDPIISGVIFGYVRYPGFEPDAQQSASPGDTVWISHRLEAPSSGQVAFGARALNPVTSSESITLYRDNNSNGEFDSGDLLLSDLIDLEAGDYVDLLVKFVVPSHDAEGAVHTFAIDANWSYTGTAETVLKNVSDTILVSGDEARLQILKSVDKSLARPGEVLTYTLILQNLGSGPITEIRVEDQTPTFSVFLDSSEVSIPTGLIISETTTPATGQSGPISWSFTGELLSTGTAELKFRVTIE